MNNTLHYYTYCTTHYTIHYTITLYGINLHLYRERALVCPRYFALEQAFLRRREDEVHKEKKENEGREIEN